MIDLLIRDDDANATSDPDAIAATYAPLLDAGHSIAFAVIPDASLDVRAPDGSIERFVGPNATSADRARGAALLDADRPMSKWLRAHAADVDVLQHGCTHARVRDGTELGALARHEAVERIANGAEILDRSLARSATGFVAPWDALSRGSLEAAAARYDLVSTGWLSMSRLPMRAWPGHFFERAARGGSVWLRRADGSRSRLLRHAGCIFTDALSAKDADAGLERVLTPSRDAARSTARVLVLHHWHFSSVAGAHPLIAALARAIRNRSDVRVVKTSQLAA